MHDTGDHRHRSILEKIARRAMQEKGFLPDFSRQAMAELEALRGAATHEEGATRDLRGLLWCSIDNDDSRDLDQLSVGNYVGDGTVRILVAIADVDALVKRQSAIDEHARQNTTSVYTAAQIFPMLPEPLSTDLTSLNPDHDRLAVVVEMIFGKDGRLRSSDLYRAAVRNRAKLAYDSVAAWLDGEAPKPKGIDAVEGLEATIRLQDGVAQQLKELRHQQGSLDLETIQTRPIFDGEVLKALEADHRNRAKDIIEEFMIAANGVSARFLAAKKSASLRRVVRTPKHWDRIVELAAERGTKLPKLPDGKALEDFLVAARQEDPERFTDLSLSVIKLLGPGEYVVQLAGGASPGHFGLAVKDYAHSTAPNRRFPDLVTQRLLKAALAGHGRPYQDDELTAIAMHCTQQEDAAKKVERQVTKSAAAILLESRIGEQFDAIVTGAADKGTWVRLLDPPVEGRLVSGFEGLAVGNRVRVKLMRTDVERGHIDFKKQGPLAPQRVAGQGKKNLQK